MMGIVVHMRDRTKFGVIDSTAAIPLCTSTLCHTTEDSAEVTCRGCIEELALHVEDAVEGRLWATCHCGHPKSTHRPAAAGDGAHCIGGNCQCRGYMVGGG